MEVFMILWTLFGVYALSGALFAAGVQHVVDDKPILPKRPRHKASGQRKPRELIYRGHVVREAEDEAEAWVNEVSK